MTGEPDATLTAVAEVEQLSRGFLVGGGGAPYVFGELVQRLLTITVLDAGAAVRVNRGPRPDRVVLGGVEGPTDPLRLIDGNYLRLSITLFHDPATDFWKTLRSSYQYQADAEGRRWLFRYDYDREPSSPYPGAHLQVRGRATEETWALANDVPLQNLHFPTGRIAIESVIRLLVEQVVRGSNTPPAHWRPVFEASERAFLAVAHQPEHGPSHDA